MDLSSLSPIFTKNEAQAIPAFSELEFTALIKINKLQVLGTDLFGQIRETRFGPLGPGEDDILEFIFRLYPQSFIGGAGAYNALGFSQQVSPLIEVFTNHSIPYTFKHFRIMPYSFPIKPVIRELYPLLEYILEPYVFTQHSNPRALLVKLLKQKTQGNDVVFNEALESYPFSLKDKIKDILK